MISAKRWWLVGAIVASATVLVAAVGGLSAVAAPATKAAVPGETTVETSAAGQFAFFTVYPDMATCELVYDTECYGLTNGIVEGEQDPDAIVNQLVTLLPGPFADLLLNLPFVNNFVDDVAEPACFDIPTMGADVDEVYDGTDLGLEVGPGDCSDFLSDVEAGTEDMIPAATDTTITPVDAQSSIFFPPGFDCPPGSTRGPLGKYSDTCTGTFPQPVKPAKPAKPEQSFFLPSVVDCPPNYTRGPYGKHSDFCYLK